MQLTSLSKLAVLAATTFVLFATVARADDRMEVEVTDADSVLKCFLEDLTYGRLESAYDVVAPSSKLTGDPIAYRAKLDFDSFKREMMVHKDPAGDVVLPKFNHYKMGATRMESPGRYRIWLDFGGDRDEVLMLMEGGRWYVADPIHICR